MDADEWTHDGAKLTDDVLQKLRRVAEDESPLIVEHRFYRGARAPHRFVCDNGDDLDEYIRSHAPPGDASYVWHFDQCCRDDNAMEHGKVPDADGRTPKRGSY